ncbi:MAG: hypothetical protein HY719_12365 [Planctomycetes bacterium]|nr:hypothetical protein [Planctomycetota bacterium]
MALLAPLFTIGPTAAPADEYQLTERSPLRVREGTVVRGSTVRRERDADGRFVWLVRKESGDMVRIPEEEIDRVIRPQRSEFHLHNDTVVVGEVVGYRRDPADGRMKWQVRVEGSKEVVPVPQEEIKTVVHAGRFGAPEEPPAIPSDATGHAPGGGPGSGPGLARGMPTEAARRGQRVTAMLAYLRNNALHHYTEETANQDAAAAMQKALRDEESGAGEAAGGAGAGAGAGEDFFRKARDGYEKALSTDRTYAAPHLGLARCFVAAGNREAARTQADIVVQKAPSNPLGYRHLELVALAEGRDAEAAQFAGRAQELERRASSSSSGQGAGGRGSEPARQPAREDYYPLAEQMSWTYSVKARRSSAPGSVEQQVAIHRVTIISASVAQTRVTATAQIQVEQSEGNLPLIPGEDHPTGVTFRRVERASSGVFWDDHCVLKMPILMGDTWNMEYGEPTTTRQARQALATAMRARAEAVPQSGEETRESAVDQTAARVVIGAREYTNCVRVREVVTHKVARVRPEAGGPVVREQATRSIVHRYFAPGVGLVLEEHFRDDDQPPALRRIEIVEFKVK